MEFNYSYSFTEKAEQDLDEILNYIAVELSNLTAAKKLVGQIFESIDGVKSFPQSGLPVENEFLSDKSVRRIVVDNYVIYYKAVEIDRTVYILRIVYGKRNLDNILKTI